MKIVKTITNILVAVTAVAGAVYVAATYGDEIVAWAKKLLGLVTPVEVEEEPVEEAAEEAPAEVQEPAAEETPAETEEPSTADSEEEPVANETDFAE